MYYFKNDYSEGAHPLIMEALMNTNCEQTSGYGLDSHCEHAASLIRTLSCNNASHVHFLVGGTQTNQLLISSALRPYQAAVAADTGHINVHETGAIEATGHKVLTANTTDGKLTPELILPILKAHTDEHMVMPKLVYISDTTEIGTIYTKAELTALHLFCKEHGLYLFLDGARLGSALTCEGNDLTLADISALTDAYYIGGTKNGLLFGEALVINNEEINENFRYNMKQRGGMLAKGRLLGVQFETILENQLYFKIASHANSMAAILRKGILEAGYQLTSSSLSNQIFVQMPNEKIDELKKEYAFEITAPGEKDSVIRLVTSWATLEEECCKFNAFIKNL